MATFNTDTIRNILLIGHNSTGKTTLLESMLFKKEITKRQGRVEDKNTVSDYEVEEKERGCSIFSSVCYLQHNGVQFNVIDIPGYSDFIGSAYGPMRIAEVALIFVCATKGIEVNTRRFWDLAVRNDVPKIFVISKLDAEHAKFQETLAKLQEVFSPKCKPIAKPDANGRALSKIDYIFGPNGDSKMKDDFIETALEADDALMESYLENPEITDEQLKTLIPKAMIKGNIIPVIPLSTLKDLGIDVVLDFVRDYAPTAGSLTRTFEKNGEVITLQQGANAPVSAFVFKTVSDPFVGKINYFRVFGGALKGQTSFWLSSTEKSERFGTINKVQGKDMLPVDEIGAGDIGAVAKIESLSGGDTISVDSARVVLPKTKYPTPMVQIAIEPKARGDEQRLNDALRRVSEEDPTFICERNKQTKELVASGLGNLHLDILLAKMKRKYDVSVNTRLPKVAYLETITGKSETRYRHKKQTGGAGQFAEVAIKMEPAERGTGFQFKNDIFGGAISGPFVASVEKGMNNVMEEGILAGCQVVDVAVSLWDGKEHPVDSKDIAFQIAGRESFKECFLAAKPTFLEPIANIEIFVPSKVLGDIISDLNSRRGRIQGTEALGEIQVVRATVPYSEIISYANDLRSLTGGEGSYNVEFSHYDIVPANLKDKIIQQAKAEKA